MIKEEIMSNRSLGETLTRETLLTGRTNFFDTNETDQSRCREIMYDRV